MGPLALSAWHSEEPTSAGKEVRLHWSDGAKWMRDDLQGARVLVGRTEEDSSELRGPLWLLVQVPSWGYMAVIINWGPTICGPH